MNQYIKYKDIKKAIIYKFANSIFSYEIDTIYEKHYTCLYCISKLFILNKIFTFKTIKTSYDIETTLEVKCINGHSNHLTYKISSVEALIAYTTKVVIV